MAVQMPTRSPARVVQGSQGATPPSQSSGLWGTPALGSALHADAERTPLRISRLAIASQPDQHDPFNQEEEVCEVAASAFVTCHRGGP